MSSPSVGSSPPRQLQQPDYSFSGRVLLTAVIILAMLTVVFVIIRLLLYQFVARGRGSLAVGFRRSFGSFGIRSTRNGLDAAALAALPVTTYRSSAAAGGAASTSGTSPSTDDEGCAVCLSELADGDKVRALPGCGHVFHVDCVDAWLRSRTTCPVCRAEVRTHKGGAPDARPSPAPASIGTARGITLVVTVEGGGGGAETRDARRASVLGSSGQPSSGAVATG